MLAHTGAAIGLEQALWYALMGSAMSSHGGAVLILTMSVTKRAPCVKVFGLLETSGFAKYMVTGSDAEVWLDTMPAAVSRAPAA